VAIDLGEANRPSTFEFVEPLVDVVLVNPGVIRVDERQDLTSVRRYETAIIDNVKKAEVRMLGVARAAGEHRAVEQTVTIENNWHRFSFALCSGLVSVRLKKSRDVTAQFDGLLG
jgi:hypothetical protein